MTPEHGPWDPLPLPDLVHLLEGCAALWWVAGGHALELHLGRSWRPHDDTDAGIRRVDGVRVLRHLQEQGWEVVVAAAGVLRPWHGRELDLAASEGNVWCRRPGGPWRLDLLVGEGTDERWVYRRDPSLTRPWSRAVLRRDGVPYLAPDLQLLFKSRTVRPKDQADADTALPHLDGGGLALLRAQLQPDHPWRPLVDRLAPACSAADAARVLALLEDEGLACWVDGGWAADALLGEQTREHGDLDLALPLPGHVRALDLLGREGFEVVRTDGPANQVVADPDGVTVDLHGFDTDVVVLDADGVRRHHGAGVAYQVDGFGGTGVIGGRAVRCIDAATLVRYHTGYEVDADDWHDVRLLCERFELSIPAEYERFRAT